MSGAPLSGAPLSDHRERGQAGLGLLVVVVALVAAGLALLALGEASDQRSGAQTGADAAALAGAVGSRDDLVAAVTSPVVAATFTGGWGALDGYAAGACGQAGAYAAANRSAVTGCAYAGGRTSVTVRSAGGGPDGLQADASAVADHQAPACAVAPPVEPEPVEPVEPAAEDDADAVPPPPPAPANRVVVCRGHGAQAFVETDPATGDVVAISPAAQWRQTFEVRLVE